MCPRDFCGRLLSSRTCARRRTKPVLTKRLQCFKEWSTESRWQDRIAQAVTERGMQLLAHAAEVDIETFFATYKLLEPKQTEVLGWHGVDEARRQIARCRERYRQASEAERREPARQSGTV